MSRESRTVIISHGSHTIRAGHGIHEPLKQPSVELTARVGLRRSHIEKLRAAQVSTDKDATQDASDATAAVAAPAENQEPPAHTYIVHPSDYLVGHFLEDAIKHPENYLDDPVYVFWPMVGGVVNDWGGMQALWYYLLFFALPVIRSSNTCVTLLALPPNAITRDSSAQIHKIFFEELNVPSFCLVDSAITSAFAVGQTNACVVDVGWRGSSVACVMDALQVNSSVRKGGVGMGECVAYLASLLERDMGVAAVLKDLEASSSSSSFSASHSSPGVIQRSSRLSSRQVLLLTLAEEIFSQGHVSLDAGQGANEAEEADKNNVDDEGNFDVLGALTSGREKQAIAEQERRNKALVEEGKEPEAVMTTASDANARQKEASGGQDTTEVTFHGLEIPIPNHILANAAMPLLDPTILTIVDPAFFALGRVSGTQEESSSSQHDQDVDWSSTPSLPSLISASINSTPDLDRRNLLWELLVITGHATSLIKGLTSSLVSSLSTYIITGGSISTSLVSVANTTTDDPSSAVAFAGAQPSNVRALKTPDYFGEFKDRTDLAPFLGATIYAKLVFADSQARGYTNKSAYSASGPGVAFAVAT